MRKEKLFYGCILYNVHMNVYSFTYNFPVIWEKRIFLSLQKKKLNSERLENIELLKIQAGFVWTEKKKLFKSQTSSYD
jgi:hypothetical protein